MDHELEQSAPGARSDPGPDARQPLLAATPAAGAASARSRSGAPPQEWLGTGSSGSGAGAGESGADDMAERLQREPQRVLRVLIGHSLGAAGAAAETIAHPEVRARELCRFTWWVSQMAGYAITLCSQM